MKKFKLSLITITLLGNSLYAGGDIAPVPAYQIEDEFFAEEASVEPIVETSLPIEIVETGVPIETIAPIETNVPAKVVAPVVKTIVPIKTVLPPVPPLPPIIPDNSANKFYIGLGLIGVKYENDCTCETLKSVENKDTTYGLMGKIGYHLQEYIDIEGRASKTNWASDGSKVEHFGIYVKPIIPIYETLNIYGLMGLAKTEVSTTNMPSADAEGLALGVGLELDLVKNITMFVDYERMHVESNSPDIDAISTGLSYSF